MGEYNKELCDERHNNLDKALDRLFSKIDIVASRLNWFYVIAILTLGGVVTNLVVMYLK